MELYEAIEIITKDSDYPDITKWKKRHYKAQDIYLRDYIGLPSRYRRKLLKDIKRAARYLKRVKNEE